MGANPDDEYLSILRINGERGVAPDAGTVVVSSPVSSYTAATRVTLQQTPVANPARQAGSLILEATASSTDLLVSDITGYAANEILRIQTSGGQTVYHRITAATVANSASTLQLDGAIVFSHELGAEIAQRAPQVIVQALDRRGWGNRLLDGTNLAGAQIAAHNNALMAGTRLGVRSRELLLSVFLLQRPDPAVPSRNNTVIDREGFVVTMDPRHSRYIHKVIGTS